MRQVSCNIFFLLGYKGWDPVFVNQLTCLIQAPRLHLYRGSMIFQCSIHAHSSNSNDFDTQMLGENKIRGRWAIQIGGRREGKHVESNSGTYAQRVRGSSHLNCLDS